MELWFDCHAFVEGSPLRVQWPDGGSLLEQPAITVAMFDLIGGQYAEEAKAQCQATTT